MAKIPCSLEFKSIVTWQSDKLKSKTIINESTNVRIYNLSLFIKLKFETVFRKDESVVVILDLNTNNNFSPNSDIL